MLIVSKVERLELSAKTLPFKPVQSAPPPPRFLALALKESSAAKSCLLFPLFLGLSEKLDLDKRLNGAKINVCQMNFAVFPPRSFPFLPEGSTDGGAAAAAPSLPPSAFSDRRGPKMSRADLKV